MAIAVIHLNVLYVRDNQHEMRETHNVASTCDPTQTVIFIVANDSQNEKILIYILANAIVSAFLLSLAPYWRSRALATNRKKWFYKNKSHRHSPNRSNAAPSTLHIYGYFMGNPESYYTQQIRRNKKNGKRKKKCVVASRRRRCC